MLMYNDSSPDNTQLFHRSRELDPDCLYMEEKHRAIGKVDSRMFQIWHEHRWVVSSNLPFLCFCDPSLWDIPMSRGVIKKTHTTSHFVRMSVSRRVHFHHFIHQLSGFVDLKQLETSSEKDRHDWHDNILVLEKVIFVASQFVSGRPANYLREPISRLAEQIVYCQPRESLKKTFPKHNNSKLRKEKVAPLVIFFCRNQKNINFVGLDARFERKKWVCLLCFSNDSCDSWCFARSWCCLSLSPSSEQRAVVELTNLCFEEICWDHATKEQTIPGW